MARKIRAGGGKPPVFKGFKTIGGTKRKVTGKGARGIGLGLHGKGRKITAKGYTGKGAFGYGHGNHGVAAPKPTGRATKAPMVVAHSKPPSHAAGTRRAPGHGPISASGGKPPVKKPPRTRRPR